jgi:hypothetical protein
MYSALLIEMLAETRLAEVAAAAERRRAEHQPVRKPRPLLPLAGNKVRYALAARIPRALITFRECVRALRTNRSTAVETH